LNEQVKRNRDRFPGDFMFQLNPAESEVLRSQIATSKTGAKNGVWKVKVFALPFGQRGQENE